MSTLWGGGKAGEAVVARILLLLVTISGRRSLFVPTTTCAEATSPVVMVTPPTLTVDLGLPFSLNCTATGQPVVRLRWLLEGISVGVSGPVLDVEHARESDTGEYTCEAMNDSGVGRAQSTVVVRYPPVIELGPVDTDPINNSALLLNCSARGEPTPNITWSKGEDSIVSEPGGRVEVLVNGSLMINPVQLTDTGTYVCNASNSLGSDQADSAMVMVQIFPIFDLVPGAMERVRHGASISLPCVAMGLPEVSYQWLRRLRGGAIVPVTLDSRVTIAEGNLTISDAMRSDEGMYICNVSNPLGYITMETNVRVLAPPLPPTSLMVTAEGASWLELTWQPPSSSSLDYIVEFRLTFDLTWRSHAAHLMTFNITNLYPHALYQVRVFAMSIFGRSQPSEAETAMTLSGVPLPTLSDRAVLTNVTSLTSSSITLTWSVPQVLLNTSFVGSLVTVQRRDGGSGLMQESFSLPNSTLVFNFTGLDPATLYQVGVALQFAGGSSGVAVTASVSTREAPPGDAPTQLVVELVPSITPDCIWVTWATPTRPHGNITSYTLYLSPPHSTRVLEGGILSYKLRPFQPFTNYTFAVSASTSAGEGPLTTPLHILTPQAAPTPPEGVTVTTINSSTLLVAWQPYARGRVPGILMDYMVHYQLKDESTDAISITVRPDRSSVVLAKLLPFATYVVVMAASTEAGRSNFTSPLEGRTGPDVSMWVAGYLELTELCPSSNLMLSWKPPRPHLLGGPPNEAMFIISYRQYNRSKVNTILPQPYSNVTTQMFVLTDLEPYTSYEVRLALTNRNGTADYSPWALNTTCDAAGPSPSNVTGLAINSSAIYVSWTPPTTVLGTLLGYTLRYRLADVSISYRLIETAGLSYMLEDLETYSLYTVGVATRTRGPVGIFSNQSVRTLGDVPMVTVMNVTVIPLCPASLNVSWRGVSPSELDGPGDTSSYLITYSTPGGGVVSTSVPYFHDNWVVISNLTVDSNYTVNMRVNNSYGVGPRSDPANGMAPEAVPSQPLNVRVESVGVASMNVSWGPPTFHGGQVHYCLRHSSLATPLCSNHTFIVLSDLQPFTFYNVTLVARTECAESTAVTVGNRTLATLPGPPQRLKVIARLPYSVHLKWEGPVLPNGILLHYNVYCGGVKYETMATSFDCVDLTPDTDYIVGVACENMEGEGSNVTFATSTSCRPSDLAVANNMITWRQAPCSVRYELVYVLVLVQELVSHDNGSYALPTRSLESFTVSELLVLTQQHTRSREDHTQSRSRRQINDGGVVYIAANLTEAQLLSGFPVGDGGQYGGYFNYPLTPGVHYRVGYRGTVPDTATPLFLSAPAPIVLEAESAASTTSSPASEVPSFPLTLVAIVGGVAGVLVLLICMAACISCLCCCVGSSDKEEVVPLQRNTSFRLSEKKRPLDPVQSFRSNKRTEALEDHSPIPVEGFVNRLMVMRTNDNQLFLEEFGSIPMTTPSMPSEVANLAVNKPKNRYYNIVPYDATRVKVKGQGSDYINASYCAGYRRQKAYIAAQGPLPGTVADFWKMVLDENVRTLVMLTNIQEKGKVKCEMYWPRGEEGCSVVHGNLEVKLLENTILADFTVRRLQLHKVGSNKDPREVVQFHFTSWPDHGVPQYATAMLAMICRVRRHYDNVCEGEGPMLVHCSAGVGRTGTFIVIDSTLQRLAQGEELIDIYGHVSLLRAQRTDMVQTEDQYFFIHEAVAEALLCGNTEVPADHLPGYLLDLCALDDSTDRTGLELEFKRLALERNDPHRWTMANKDANKTKNRFVNVLPYDSSRVVLKYCPGVDGSDYINASHVDSYRCRRAFIAGQGPLEGTVLDFWRLIWEHSVPVVVMLTDLQERGRECSAGYFPGASMGPFQFGPYQVEVNVERVSSTYTYRDFSITDTSSGEKRLLLHFQFHGWPEVGVPQPLLLMDFLREVQKFCESLSSRGPVLVHCSNGVGRTGVFITLHIVLERVLHEGLVDVFQTVKNLRIQRPAMVQTLEQYQFCYDAIVHYIQTSDSLAVALSRQRQNSVSSAHRQGSRRGSRRGSRSRSSDRKSKNRSPSLSPTRTNSITKATPRRSESLRESGEIGVGVTVQCHTPVEVSTEVSNMYGGSENTSTFGPPRHSQELVPLSQTSCNGLQDHTGVQPSGGSSSATSKSLHNPDLTSHSVIANGNNIATPHGTPGSTHVTNGPYPANNSPYLATPSINHTHSPQVGTPINHTHSPAVSSNLLVSSLLPQDSSSLQGVAYHQLQDISPHTDPASYHTHLGESTKL